MNTEFYSFEPLYYKSQVVAGMNYEVIYDVGYGEYITVKYFQDFDGSVEFHDTYYVRNPEEEY